MLICDAVHLTNNGNDFCIGFMRSALNDPVRILIGTQSYLSIVFHLEYPLSSVIRTTTKNDPYEVNLFGEDVVNAVTAETSGYDDRNKGICIISTNGTDALFVLAYITLSDRTSASYLALPYQEMLTNEYEYYALSSSSSSDIYYSGLLLVGFRDNTTVVIYPSIALNIRQDTQDRNSISKLICAGENHTITLHRGQTLFLGKDQGDDVTGTRVVSDKPLTVISGHEAGSVPSDGTAEPMAQQIPPTQLWGKRFLIVPFAGHDEGQYIKVLTSKDNTQVTYTCVDYNSVHIQHAGNVHQFFVSSDTYCYLEANKSVLVGQFAASLKGNTDGDITMVLVVSLDQYSNSFFFSTLNSSGLTHYISISVSSEYFDPDSILYDDISIETEWTTIYDDENRIIGYGCAFEVLQGLHTVAHMDCIGCLFVMVYGSTTGRAYSYPAGLTLPSKNGKYTASFHIEKNWRLGMR